MTLIPKEVTEEKENYAIENKENQEKENKKISKMKMTNTTTTTGESQKNIHDISLSIL